MIRTWTAENSVCKRFCLECLMNLCCCCCSSMWAAEVLNWLWEKVVNKVMNEVMNELWTCENATVWWMKELCKLDKSLLSLSSVSELFKNSDCYSFFSFLLIQSIKLSFTFLSWHSYSVSSSIVFFFACFFALSSFIISIYALRTLMKLIFKFSSSVARLTKYCFLFFTSDFTWHFKEL